jgi:antitoxin (DNA-binding transcriptional repressor) of toxin-antitoxin stability system
MKTVTVDEMRDHLDDLLEGARAGEAFEIVRGGVKIAELLKTSPTAPTNAEAITRANAPVSMSTQQEREAVLAGIRSRSGLRGLTIRELRDEGRR